jgi:hypothetical protein
MSTRADDIFKAYEDGKHRRYELLFAVNGGAFALAKLFSEHNTEKFLGNLTLPHVAVGLIVFTLVMGVDIFVFGCNMREKAEAEAKKAEIEACAAEAIHELRAIDAHIRRMLPYEGIFSGIGRLVLFLLCMLIIGGWLMVVGLEPLISFVLWLMIGFGLFCIWYTAAKMAMQEPRELTPSPTARRAQVGTGVRDRSASGQNPTTPSASACPLPPAPDKLRPGYL